MKNQDPPIVFDKERAASYERSTAVLDPMREAFHSLINVILSELPTDARILCGGVGTGLGLIDLAQAFPRWQFTAVEPATPMLDICRRRVEESGITSRCTFHEGYLDSLPVLDSFDAATCLLVSHFLLQKEERRNFFNQIALRLRPQGYLISSDIASDRSTAAYQSLLEVWIRMIKSLKLSNEHLEELRAAYGRDVAVLPPQEVESIIASSNFDTPALFFQRLIIHDWYSRRTSLE
jgi:tRNA (cmo5U34)-methyltransferase